MQTSRATPVSTWTSRLTRSATPVRLVTTHWAVVYATTTGTRCRLDSPSKSKDSPALCSLSSSVTECFHLAGPTARGDHLQTSLHQRSNVSEITGVNPASLPPFLLSCSSSFIPSPGAHPLQPARRSGNTDPGRQTVSVHSDVKIGLLWVVTFTIA